MLTVAVLSACAFALIEAEHRRIAAALATLLAMSWAAQHATSDPPPAAYLIFPVADLYLALAVLHGRGKLLAICVASVAWLLLTVSYEDWTPELAHGIAAAATITGLVRRTEEIDVTPEVTVATVLGCSDLAALYPLSRPSWLWTETARPQSLTVWTILAILEIYWTWRRWPPSWSWRPASGWVGHSSTSASYAGGSSASSASTASTVRDWGA